MSAQPPAVRASDAERERTVEVLRAHAVDGRLTLEEFALRIDTAYAARTRDELENLTLDLPREPAAVTRKRRRAKFLTGVLFGHVIRKGRWRVPRFAVVIVSFGDADIDLRHAEISGDIVTITAFVLFGNVDFYVPEGVEVDLGGFTIFGARGEHGEDVAPAHAPQLRIRAFLGFGNADVWRVPAGTTGSYRELIRSVKARRQLGAG